MSQRQWTFAVWMAGDNDLEKYADRDLAEIKKVGSTAEVAIVAQVDRFKDDRTRRYLLRKGGKVAKDQVQDLGETNSGDPAVASDFFAWALETYPADRFCAVLWNHGSGIDEAKARGARRSRGRTPLFGASRAAGPRPRGIGYDDTSADFLDNVELRQMLAAVRTRTGRTIDLLGMDACLMSLLEVALECAPYAQTLVSSQETEPLDGWPYDRLLADLVARPGQTARDLARGIVRDYVDSYKYDYVTLSALDLGERDGVVAGVDQLAEALLEATANGTQERLAFRAALAAAQRFDTRDFVDLGSLCCELAAATTAQPVRAACRRITTAIPTMVVAEEHRGKPVEQASGVSIYVPLGGVSVDYSRLRLARETRWGAFVSEAERWPRPSSGAAAARPSGRRRRSAVSNRAPVRVLAVHGIGGVERDLRWQPAWERLFRQGIGRFTDRAVEVDFLGLDDMFEAYPVTAGDALEALVKLGASGLYHGVKDALLGTRAFAPLDTVRWTAGMVVQWASNERLRESLRGRLSDRVAKGAPVDLLAAHSLGSLVTYDTFGRRENRKALARTALLTFGSQLGSPFVRGQFDGYIGPVGASFWCHAYNPYDPVFTAELRVPGDRFQQVVVGRNQPGLIADHDAVHYLADPGVIDVGLRAAAPAESTRRLGGVDAPSRRKAAPKPTRRALVVGIDDYPDPAARLDGCVNDAYLMSEVLQEIGIAAADIRLVLNGRATATGIRERLEWLLDGVRDGDVRVLVYCGHGAQVAGYGGAGEVDHLDECLVPWDFDWSRDRAILDDWFNGLYAQLPYGAEFTAVLDCCHSGGMARAGGARVRGLALPGDLRHRELEWKGGSWSARAMHPPNAAALERWRSQPSRVGSTGAARKLGRAIGLRWLPEGEEGADGAVEQVRRAFGHKGPYMPLLLEACKEDELAYEHTAGTAAHGAFSYFLAQTIRSFRKRRQPLTVGRLMAETAKVVGARYKQTPKLEGPTSRRKQRLA